MAKTWLIAKHEYLSNVKHRRFLFVTFGIPLFTIIVTLVVGALAVNNDNDPTRLGTVGYVDQAGVLQKKIDEPIYFRDYPSEDAAKAALNDGTVGAYFVIPANYMVDGDIKAVGKSDIPDALNDTLDTYLRANLGSGLDPQIAARLKDPIESSVKTLDNGRVLSESSLTGLIFVPIIFVVLFMFASQTTSGYMMSSVVEEKSNRIMEILVVSVTPFQLLLGKIIGLGLLSLTQLIFWAISGYIGLLLGRNVSFLEGVTIPADLLIAAVVYFILGYFLLATVMAGIGVVIGSEQESRQFAAIFTILTILPVFFITSFVADQNSTIVTVLTLFPLTSPVAVLLRLGLGSVPGWQLIASVVILLLTSLITAWVSARIFRWALLLYGNRPSIRELIRVVRQSESMATSATGEQQS